MPGPRGRRHPFAPERTRFSTAGTGWSTPALTSALSVSQLVAAVVGIPVGRQLDWHCPRRVMTAGSLLGVPAVATMQNLAWFYAGWVLSVRRWVWCSTRPRSWRSPAGWARPCAGVHRPHSRRGLASTVFAPFAGAALAHLLGSYASTSLVLGALAIVAAALSFFTSPQQRQYSS